MAKIATNQERLNQLFDSDPHNDSAIGEALGVSKQTISAWRNGTRSPKRSMLIKLAQYYNTTAEWLMGWDLPAPNAPASAGELSMLEMRLISAFRSADPKYRELALELLEEHPTAQKRDTAQSAM